MDRYRCFLGVISFAEKSTCKKQNGGNFGFSYLPTGGSSPIRGHLLTLFWSLLLGNLWNRKLSPTLKLGKLKYYLAHYIIYSFQTYIPDHTGQSITRGVKTLLHSCMQCYAWWTHLYTFSDTDKHLCACECTDTDNEKQLEIEQLLGAVFCFYIWPRMCLKI